MNDEKEIIMSVLLITYDNSGMKLSIDPVLSLIQGYKHVQLSDNSYAIETDEKTRTIFNKIMPFVTKSAHLLVVTLVKPFAGPVLEHMSEWLSKHLPED